MKKLEFTTSKGSFILEESSDKNLGRVLVKYMTEEQFADVVDSDDDYGVTMYQNYATTSMAYFDEQITAKESFESLVKSLGWYLFENPECPNQFCDNGYIDLGYNEKAICSICEEAEERVFENPILLKKL